MPEAKARKDNRKLRTERGPKGRAQRGQTRPPNPQATRQIGVPQPASDFSQSTFERHAALLGRMSHPMYARQRAMMMEQLQRDYGNQYVQRLVDQVTQQRAEGVQTKLTVGPAGDRYEQEADRLAKKVVGMIDGGADQAAQRQEMDEEELQAKSLAQRQELEDEELAQMKPLQRQELDEEELQAKPLVQLQVSLEGGDVAPDLEQSIQKLRGSGQPLAENVRTSMEGAFGADFSGVRVHTGAEADALNDSMSARAFTAGRDIFFRQGEYNPGSTAGKEVLAHELTHVVQQNGSAVQRDQQQGDWQANQADGLQREEEEELQLKPLQRQEEEELTENEEQEWLQAKPQIQRHPETVLQRAWTGRRQLKPLKFLGKPWVVRKSGNIVNMRLFHEHIFFEDGLAPPDIGHMGKHGLGQDGDRIGDYSRVLENLDDAKMRQAVANIDVTPGQYNLLTNNCQDYVQNVLKEYRRL